MELDAAQIQLVGLSIDITATIILTLHVILIHRKLRADVDGNSIVILSGREAIEEALLYVSVSMYFIGFMLFVWANFKGRNEDAKRRFLLEKHLGIDLTDIRGITMLDVQRFEREKKVSNQTRHVNRMVIDREGDRLELSKAKYGGLDNLKRKVRAR